MNNRFRVSRVARISSVAVGFVAVVSLGSMVAMAGADEQLSELGWLEGLWVGDTGEGRFEARYTGADGGLVLSTNKMLGADGRLQSWEYEQFRVQDGAVIMRPYPGGTTHYQSNYPLFRFRLGSFLAGSALAEVVFEGAGATVF